MLDYMMTSPRAAGAHSRSARLRSAERGSVWRGDYPCVWRNHHHPSLASAATFAGAPRV